jgi:hypothetical protein
LDDINHLMGKGAEQWNKEARELDLVFSERTEGHLCRICPR